MSSTARTLPPSEVSVSWILGLDALPAHIDPDSLALQWVDGERSYADLRRRARSLASAMLNRGLAPGDRVGAHLLNRGETFELYFACAYAGLTLVPVSFRLTPREIGLISSDAELKLVFTQADLAATLFAGLDESSASRPQAIVLDDRWGGNEFESMASFPATALNNYTPLQLLLYTSGTTGRPKGVMLRHSNIMWCAMQQATYYDMDPATVTMLTGPMYNTAALNEQSIPTFLAGGTVTIMPSRGWKPHVMGDLMDGWGVTHALIYPSMMDPMLESDRQKPIPLASLKFALTGGENCPPAVLARFRARWPHVRLCVAYGSTESGIVSLIAGSEIERRPGSVGRPAGGQTFISVDEYGTPVPANQIGRIWTAGPSVVAGYWHAPELDAQVLRDGWLDMGDLGRIDEDGYLYIEGRSKDMIISKGQNIYPAEIENTLLEHSAVLEVAVIGVPDDEAGEAVCAVVVLREGHTVSANELIGFVQQRIASYKKPKHVVFQDELPRTPAGKVLKGDLSQYVTQAIKERV